MVIFPASQEHSNICEYEDVSCYYCPNGVQRRLLNEHTTECQNRIVQCEYCEEEIVFRLREVRLELNLGKHRHARRAELIGIRGAVIRKNVLPNFVWSFVCFYWSPRIGTNMAAVKQQRNDYFF